jgi:hypothetical protein
MKHPREYPPDAFRELASAISRGEYRRFDDPISLPSALSRVAAFPDRENYRTCVLMASLSSQHPPTIGGIAPASSSPVYRVCTVRFDQHESAGEAHLNKDDVLLFEDRAGLAWQLHAHDQPGHYTRLSTDSHLQVAMEAYSWPKHQRGTLASLEAAGALVDFSTGKG